MVYKLKPLELSLDLEDRGYDLGDTINVQVTLTPNGDVDVREARVDLVCEERYSERSTVSMETPIIGVGGRGASSHKWATTTVSKQVNKQRKETYIYNSAVFLKDTRLISGGTDTRHVRLDIQPDPPPHFEEARALQLDSRSSWTFKWRLVATVNVARGRDPKVQRALKIRLPQPAAGGVGTKHRMSTPKRRTGSAPGE